MRRISSLAVLGLFGLIVGSVVAQELPVPHVIRIGGVTTGTPGTVAATLSLYAEATGGTALWSEHQTLTVAGDGHYTTFLGAATPKGVPLELFASGDARWLGVQLEGESEQPRTLLASVPYALKAADAETVGGKPLSAFVLAGDRTGTGADGLTYVNAAVLGAALERAGANPSGGAASTLGLPGYLGVFTDTVNLGNSALFQDTVNPTTLNFVGVRTTTPQAQLHVQGTQAPAAFFEVVSNSLGALPGVYRAARGTPALPSAVQTDDILGGLAVRGYGSTKFSGGRGQVMFKAAENWTDAANGTYLVFATEPIGASTIASERMRITPDGKVGIGTSTPAYALSVAGTIESTSGGFRFPDGTTQTTAVGVGGNIVSTGTIAMPDTTSSSVGVLTAGANSFLHEFGSSTNAFVGGRAGGAFAATGGHNTGVGYQSLYSLTTGTNNSALGHLSLFANTTGNFNTAIGNAALTSATTANGNIAVGDTALGATTTGNNNVAFGFHALWKNTTATSNAAFGYYALSSNTTGQYNTGIGDTALAGNTTGSNNTGLGRYAGQYNATGGNNVYLGYNAGPDSTHTALKNSVAIGANAVVGQSDTLVLGGTGVNAVNVGIGTSTPAQALSVVGTIESTSGGFKFPDATTQATAGMSQTVADSRYLQLTGGALSNGLTINHSSTSSYGLYVNESGYNGIRVDQDANWAAIYAYSPGSGMRWGVSGIADSSSGSGVIGSSSAGVGVVAKTTSGTALTATVSAGGAGTAARFTGDVTVIGDLSKSGGSFTIDHPLDPEHKYLKHSFVESPDMKNIYDGVVTLDAEGRATVVLPDWFGALNRDFRYQLTAIGAPGPNLYIARELANNEFAIGGGTPGAKVSWMVTGIRQDAYANAHRIVVEEDKPLEQVGKFLHPELFNQSVDRAIGRVDRGDGTPGVIKQ